MSECFTTVGNKIFVNCIHGDKCEDWKRCEKRHHHVWYEIHCHCGGKKLTYNPKIRSCSHICDRRLNKDITLK